MNVMFMFYILPYVDLQLIKKKLFLNYDLFGLISYLGDILIKFFLKID